jgi:hypothetical protein
MLVRAVRVSENSVVAIHALERKGSAEENLVLLLVALERVSMKYQQQGECGTVIYPA